MIVVDASVLVAVVADDGEAGQHARRMLRDQEVCLPDFAIIEVISVLRRLLRSGAVSLQRCEQAFSALENMPAERFSVHPLARRVFELRENVSPYDAAYVALAESLQCPLCTADRRLAAAPGLACEVRVLGL